MLSGLFLSLLLSSDLGAAVLPRFEFPVVEEERSPLAIRAKRVILRPGVEIANGVILIERGVIVAAGENVAIPEGARLIEGEVACAGFVDPWSSVGIDPASMMESSSTPATRTVDALNPYYLPEERREALLGGVTAARVQIARWASFSGVGTLVHTSEGDRPAIVLEDACVAGCVGLTREGRTPDVFDRVSEVDRLVTALEKGRRYRESQLEYEKELAEWNTAIAEKGVELEKGFKKAKKDREKDEKTALEKGKEFKPKRYKEDKKPRPVRPDPDDAVLARAVDGEIPLVVEVHRESEIRRLLQKTEPHDRLRLVIAGGTEALPFAEELVARKIPVILWPVPMGSPRTDEYEAHDLALAGELSRAGVRVLIGSGGGDDARELRFLASLAVGHGMERDAALAAITTAPAQVFDVGDRLGQLEVGRSGDVLVLDGDPLDSGSRLRFVVSRGEVVIE